MNDDHEPAKTNHHDQSLSTVGVNSHLSKAVLSYKAVNLYNYSIVHVIKYYPLSVLHTGTCNNRH